MVVSRYGIEQDPPSVRKKCKIPRSAEGSEPDLPLLDVGRPHCRQAQCVQFTYARHFYAPMSGIRLAKRKNSEGTIQKLRSAEPGLRNELRLKEEVRCGAQPLPRYHGWLFQRNLEQ